MLKDKEELKELHQRFKTNLARVWTTVIDGEKARNALVSESTHLFANANFWKQKATKLEDDRLKWKMNTNANKDYISHMYYLLDPLMDKLPKMLLVASEAYITI